MAAIGGTSMCGRGGERSARPSEVDRPAVQRQDMHMELRRARAERRRGSVASEAVWRSMAPGMALSIEPGVPRADARESDESGEAVGCG